jgi:hypothetical protein
VKIVKQIGKKGGAREWSNRYFLNQTSIPDLSHFNTLADAIVAAEKAIYPTTNQIIRAVGYNGGSDVPLFTKNYTTNGTWTPGTNDKEATPDSAILVRYSTTQRTTKNHPIYLFNYYHHAFYQQNVAADAISTAQKALVATYAAAWITGFSDGVTTYKKAGPFGAVAQTSVVSDYITHRDFPA